jgi:hypothetical protein
MSLDRYVKNARLRREAMSAKEITDQSGLVAQSMKDVSAQNISDGLRFYTTFNAVLALANIALRASGYPKRHTFSRKASDSKRPSIKFRLRFRGHSAR